MSPFGDEQSHRLALRTTATEGRPDIKPPNIGCRFCLANISFGPEPVVSCACLGGTFMSFFAEFKRRHAFRRAIACAATAWSFALAAAIAPAHANKTDDTVRFVAYQTLDSADP